MLERDGESGSGNERNLLYNRMMQSIPTRSEYQINQQNLPRLPLHSSTAESGNRPKNLYHGPAFVVPIGTGCESNTLAKRLMGAGEPSVNTNVPEPVHLRVAISVELRLRKYCEREGNMSFSANIGAYSGRSLWCPMRRTVPTVPGKRESHASPNVIHSPHVNFLPFRSMMRFRNKSEKGINPELRLRNK